ADQEVDGQVELYSSTNTGSSRIKLSPPSPPAFMVGERIDLTVNGMVVYNLLNSSTSDVLGAFSVLQSGGTVYQLTGPELLAYEEAHQSTADGRRIVYFTDQFNLFSVALAGDSDNDGVQNFCDGCPLGLSGQHSQVDADADGIPDECDNCKSVYNPSQADTES